MLFVLWTIMSTIVATFYLGTMSSEMIRPSPPVTIQTAKELNDRNFTLIYQYKNHQDLLSSLANIQNNSLLLTFLKTSEVHPKEADFIYELACGERKAVFHAWTAVCQFASMATKLINELKLSTTSHSRKVSRKCFVGQELIPAGNLYYGVLPPRQNKLEIVMGLMFETGIYYRWINEYIRLATADRVQDRVKLKSRTI